MAEPADAGGGAAAQPVSAGLQPQQPVSATGGAAQQPVSAAEPSGPWSKPSADRTFMRDWKKPAHQQSTHSKFFDDQGLAIFALHWKKPVQERNVELARRWSLQMRVNDLEMKARGGGLPRVASRQKSSSLYGQSFSGCQKVVGGGGVYSSQGLGVWRGSQGSPGATFPAISEPNRAL
eukprot:gene14707-biopygen20122